MGEIVVSSEESMEVQLGEEVEEDKDISTGLIRWERFLHRMSIRVMLVESDDSTRQIIAALLRKCGYKVIAISDGLKAWETLKGRPHNIDLILTEVELPSISGFGLLTMSMEHEICKNIPVIMMSSHDSIGVVFKCMLRGAADFLVKPVRKNELRNLWQHVWRRQSSNGGMHGRQDGSPAQQKVEDTSENNAASNNHSSDYVASGQKNKECCEKESDTQSSCTKPDMEAENACMQNMQDHLQPKRKSSSLSSGKKMQKHIECLKLDERLPWHESELEDKSIGFEHEDAPCNRANNSTGLTVAEEHASARTVIQSEDVAQESHREDANANIPRKDANANLHSKTKDDNYEQVEPSREAIDLIGAFDNLPRVYKSVVQEVSCSDAKAHSHSNDATNKLSSSPLLELSLSRSHPSDHGNQWTDRRHTLNHSNASAFSWYNNKKMRPLFPTTASFHTESKECANNSLKHLPNQGSGDTADAPRGNGIPVNNNWESMSPLFIGRTVQDDSAYPCPKLRVSPVPVPVSSGVRFDSLCSGYDAAFPPMFYAQSGPQALWSPNSASQQVSTFQVNSSHESRPEVHNFGQGFHLCDQNATSSTNKTLHEQVDRNLESVEDPVHVPPATGQIGTSSLCNGALSHLNSSGCGSVCNESNGNVTSAAVTRTTAESGNDEGLFIRDGIRGTESHRSFQREAALNKFRLKRKERCYEKKVRYQSRKRLAEQRPRVKGQFVRQVPADSSS